MKEKRNIDAVCFSVNIRHRTKEGKRFSNINWY